MSVDLTHRTVQLTCVEQCTSTQLLARELLEQSPKIVHVVRTQTQQAGVGRAGRGWENPPETGLLLSIAVHDVGAAQLLDGLVRRIVEQLLRRLTTHFDLAPSALQWSAPNDLVSAADGAKVAGILVDAQTIGAQLRELRVGVGVNVAGPAWITHFDARTVTTLEAIAQRPLAVDHVSLDAAALNIAADVLALLA